MTDTGHDHALKMDRSVFEQCDLSELDDRKDVAYWRSQPAEDRFAALELLRQTFYNYDPATTRLSRFFEIVEPAQG